MAEEPNGTPSNVATRSIAELARGGDPEAQYKLGHLHWSGNGVVVDLAEGFQWFLRSAEQGHAAAQCYVGFAYSQGHGVPQAFDKAVHWYSKSADQGYAQAQHNLGVCYEYGRGVPADRVEARRCYKRAADQGHSPSADRISQIDKNKHQIIIGILVSGLMTVIFIFGGIIGYFSAIKESNAQNHTVYYVIPIGGVICFGSFFFKFVGRLLSRR